MKQIQIHGAGLSGLVAAINLAKAGYRVVVFERENYIGGSPQYHPSAHMTPMHGPSTWEYIGIDLDRFFAPLDRFTVYIGEKDFNMDPTPLFVVERGGRKSSLDYFLFTEAQKLGVDFQFSAPITPEKLSSLPENSIIATGLHPEMFQALKIPTVTFQYHIATGRAPKGNLCFGYWDHYTPDYGYVAITNELLLALVFARVRIKKDAGELFRKRIQDTEGLDITRWRHFSGSNPLRPTLFAGKLIVAGNLAGMMEPLFTFGIVGALHSGRIAAMAVMDRERALKDFKEFTRHHVLLHKIPPVIRKTPWLLRKALLIKMLQNPERFGWATDYISGGIPGYKGPRFVRKIKERN